MGHSVCGFGVTQHTCTLAKAYFQSSNLLFNNLLVLKSFVTVTVTYPCAAVGRLSQPFLLVGAL